MKLCICSNDRNIYFGRWKYLLMKINIQIFLCVVIVMELNNANLFPIFKMIIFDTLSTWSLMCSGYLCSVERQFPSNQHIPLISEAEELALENTNVFVTVLSALAKVREIIKVDIIRRRHQLSIWLWLVLYFNCSKGNIISANPFRNLCMSMGSVFIVLNSREYRPNLLHLRAKLAPQQ